MGEIVFAVGIIIGWIVLLVILGAIVRDYWLAGHRPGYRSAVFQPKRRLAAWWRCPSRLAIEPATVRCDRHRRHRGDHRSAAKSLTWSEERGTFTVTIDVDDRRMVNATPAGSPHHVQVPGPLTVVETRPFLDHVAPAPSFGFVTGDGTLDDLDEHRTTVEQSPDFRQLLDRNMERHADLLGLLANDSDDDEP